MDSIEYALTLHQPWGTAVVLGHKSIENRKWAPHQKVIGKRIWIHAGNVYDPAGEVFCRERGRIYTKDQVQHGAIIGSVDVVGYVKLGEGSLWSENAWVLNDPWFFGPFGWILKNPTRLRVSVPCRGYQTLWRPNVLVMEKLRAATGGRDA